MCPSMGPRASKTLHRVKVPMRLLTSTVSHWLVLLLLLTWQQCDHQARARAEEQQGRQVRVQPARVEELLLLTHGGSGSSRRSRGSGRVRSSVLAWGLDPLAARVDCTWSTVPSVQHMAWTYYYSTIGIVGKAGFYDGHRM